MCAPDQIVATPSTMSAYYVSDSRMRRVHRDAPCPGSFRRGAMIRRGVTKEPFLSYDKFRNTTHIYIYIYVSRREHRAQRSCLSRVSHRKIDVVVFLSPTIIARLNCTRRTPLWTDRLKLCLFSFSFFVFNVEFWNTLWYVMALRGDIDASHAKEHATRRKIKDITIFFVHEWSSRSLFDGIEPSRSTFETIKVIPLYHYT